MDSTFGDTPYYNVGSLPVNEIELPPVPSAESIELEHVKDELRRTKNSVKDVLVHLHGNGDITSEAAEYVLEAIGLETKVTKRVSGIISFSGDIELSIFDDADYMYSSDFNVDGLSISRDYEDLTNLDYDVEDVNYED